MKKTVKIPMVKTILNSIILLLTALTLSACVPAMNYHRAGFEHFNRFYDSFDHSPDLYKEYHIKLKVVVVGDQALFDWPFAQVHSNGVLGYARPSEVWLLGKQTKHGVLVNQAALGHELLHVLNFIDQNIINPDSYSTLFRTEY